MASDEEQLRIRIAAAILRRREELHLNQEEAAERAGISDRYWSELENAKSGVGLEVVRKILGGLGWSWYDLADSLSSPSPAARDEALHRLLTSALERTDPRGREVLTAILQAFATTYEKVLAPAAQAAESKEPY